MKKCFFLALVVFGLTAAVFTESSKESQGKYSLAMWGHPPGDWGHTASVVSDHKNSILVFRRLDPPILVFNPEGKVVSSFGDGMFKRPHSLAVDKNGFVWATDTDENIVYKFDMQGKLLLTLGKKNVAGDNESHDLFNGPTDVAIAPNGDIFVSDGDRNNRIVKFTKDGKFVKVIGGMKSSAPGQFGPADPNAHPTSGIVHAIVFDSKGRLLTMESYNPRIQVFDEDGKFLEQWPIAGGMKPCGLAIAPDDTLYIGDTDANAILIMKNGKVVDKVYQKGLRPHNVGLDPKGSLFIADVDTEKGPSTYVWKMVKN